MASFRDFSLVCREIGFTKYAVRVYNEINADNVFTHAAAMAYAWIFAVFPFFIVLLTLIPYIPAKYREDARSAIEHFFQRSGMPHGVTETVLVNVDTVMKDTHTGLLSFGLLLTLYAASGGMNMTMSALDEAMDIEKPRPYIYKRLMAMALTIFMTVGFILVLVLFPVATTARNLLVTNIDHLPPALRDLFSGQSLLFMDMSRYAIGLVVVLAMIGVLYNFGPSRRGRYRLFTPGSIFVVFGWLITGWALRFYFERFANYSKTYGAVAGMVIMLMVFYLDATIILVGAEIDSEVDCIKRDLIR
ncbi:MAG: YihY/virulence factor BrkB family protein, partial [Tepidisphaeraceae bacterium]